MAAGLSLAALRSASTARTERTHAVAAEATAVAERDTALSRQLAAQAITHLTDQYDLALLLSLEARRTADTVEARGGLLQTLEARPAALTSFLPTRGMASWALAVSPDGRTLAWATSMPGSAIYLWDVLHQRELDPPLISHLHGLYNLSFGAGGKTIAANSGDGRSVEVWDIARRRPAGPVFSLSAVEPSPGPTHVDFAAVSPDGKTAAFAYGNAVYLWDMPRKKLAATLATSREVYTMAIAPDGKTLAAGEYGGPVELWNLEGSPRRRTLAGHVSVVDGLAFSADGKILASGSNDMTVRLWDVQSGNEIGAALAGHTRAVNALAFSRDGTLLASGDMGGSIELWDMTGRRLLATPLDSHTGAPNFLAFGAKDTALFAADGNGTIAAWDVATALAGPALLADSDQATVASLTFSPDGRSLVSGDWNGNAQIWNTATWESGTWHDAYLLWGSACAFSRDGRTLITAGDVVGEGFITVYDARRGTQVKVLRTTLTATADTVMRMALSPDASIAAVGYHAGTQVELWDLRLGKLLRPVIENRQGELRDLAFSPDGKTLASVWSDGTVRLWDVVHRRPYGRPLTGHIGAVNSVAFSPDGRLLATGGDDYTVRLWKVSCACADGAPVQLTSFVSAVAFSPDGTLLATGGGETTVQLWDVATRQPLGPPLRGLSQPVIAAAFSANGKLLAAGDYNGNIHEWDVDLASWPARACEVADRNLTAQEWAQYLGDRPYHKTCPGAP